MTLDKWPENPREIILLIMRLVVAIEQAYYYAAK